jgi:hypothetical protein
VGTDDDLAELRRRAFSRDGTPEDLRRLAEREPPPSPAPEADIAPAIEPLPDQPDDAPPPPNRAGRRGILIAGAVGLAMGATIATLGIQLSPRAEPQPQPLPAFDEVTALAIFDREPTERDDPAQLAITLEHILPGGLEDAELRWLGAVAEREVYVARGTYDEVTTICLISSATEYTTAACTEESDFAFRGLTLGDGQLEFRWGPLGTEIWLADRPD